MAEQVRAHLILVGVDGGGREFPPHAGDEGEENGLHLGPLVIRDEGAVGARVALGATVAFHHRNSPMVCTLSTRFESACSICSIHWPS